METCTLPTPPQTVAKLCSAKTPATPYVFLLQTITPERLNTNPALCMAQGVRLSVAVDWQIFADFQDEADLMIPKPKACSCELPTDHYNRTRTIQRHV